MFQMGRVQFGSHTQMIQCTVLKQTNTSVRTSRRPFPTILLNIYLFWQSLHLLLDRRKKNSCLNVIVCTIHILFGQIHSHETEGSPKTCN